MNLSKLISSDRIMIHYDTFSTFILISEADMIINKNSKNIYEEIYNLIKNRIVASTTKPVNAQVIHKCIEKAILSLQNYKNKKINGEN